MLYEVGVFKIIGNLTNSKKQRTLGKNNQIFSLRQIILVENNLFC